MAIIASANCQRFQVIPKTNAISTLKRFANSVLFVRDPKRTAIQKYYPTNSYIALQYETLLTAMPNVDGNFGEDVYNSFMRYFNDEVLSAFYKEMCVYWLKENINSILMDYIDTKDLSYNNVKMYNFACEKKADGICLLRYDSQRKTYTKAHS